MIEVILNEDGTEYSPPRNPLTEKWEKLYPACGSGGGYKCMYCGKCPYGDYWKVPEEDKAVYMAYYQTVMQYDLDHGNIINDEHRATLKKMIKDTKEFLERLTYDNFTNQESSRI